MILNVDFALILSKKNIVETFYMSPMNPKNLSRNTAYSVQPPYIAGHSLLIRIKTPVTLRISAICCVSQTNLIQPLSSPRTYSPRSLDISRPVPPNKTIGIIGTMLTSRTNSRLVFTFKSNQIKSNQIKSNQIKSNQIKSNQIKIKSKSN